MIEITELSKELIDSIYEIEVACFSTPWSKESLEYDIGNPLARYFVLVEDGQVYAYLGVRTVIDEVHIMNIAVAQKYRGRGYGKLLLDELLVFCLQGQYVEISLEVRESNKEACGLYEKYGFERCGRRANYYDKPIEDAVLMVKRL